MNKAACEPCVRNRPEYEHYTNSDVRCVFVLQESRKGDFRKIRKRPANSEENSSMSIIAVSIAVDPGIRIVRKILFEMDLVTLATVSQTKRKRR